jgi:hypothetical protein
MGLFDGTGYDPNAYKPQGSAALPGYIGGTGGTIQATPMHVNRTPVGPNGVPITGAPAQPTMPQFPGTVPGGGGGGGGAGTGPDVVPFGTNPNGPAPEYGGNLAHGDPGRKLWQNWVGNTDNWIQREMGEGDVITGAPSQFQGDINVLNRYGQFGINPNGTVPVGQIREVNGVSQPSNQTRPATAAEMAALNAYQNWNYGQENQPGGGGTQAWGKYQGYGPDTASGTWGGAYSAYMANQALSQGISPGAYLGHPLGPGEHTSDPAMANAGGYLVNNNQQVNQYGIPVGATNAPPFTTNTEDVFQSRIDAANRAAQTQSTPPVLNSSSSYDPYAQLAQNHRAPMLGNTASLQDSYMVRPRG